MFRLFRPLNNPLPLKFGGHTFWKVVSGYSLVDCAATVYNVVPNFYTASITKNATERIGVLATPAEGHG